MTARHTTKFVHEGNYVAEVGVELTNSDTGWSPYLFLDEAYRLDHVRAVLCRGDIRRASSLARVFELKPVTV